MAGERPLILIVDDEPQIRTLLRSTLARAGYSSIEAATGREALNAKDIDRPDLVLLDLGLPDRDGIELVTALGGGTGTAVIVVSAREETEQKGAALDLGAADYVTKPFDTEELLARIRGALRRRQGADGGEGLVQAGSVSIDLVRRTVEKSGERVHLTPKEYAVLAELAAHSGRVLTHRHLLRSIWGPAQEGQTEYLRVTVRGLRQKLEIVPSQPRLIINEPAVGYRLIVA
jgi:two-component system KDP operon response regulator KdpE